MKKCCPHNPDAGLLLIRIGLATVFIVHGWMKLSNIDATVGFFGSVGLPALLAWLVAIIEFVGGIMVLLGVYTCIASGLLAVIMIGAIVTVKGALGFVGGYEFDLILLTTALGLASVGPGKYTACSFFQKKGVNATQGKSEGYGGGCCGGGSHNS